MRRLTEAVEDRLSRLDDGVTGWIVLGVAVAASVAAMLYRTRHGIFVSNDAAAYLARARAFSQGNLALDAGGAGGGALGTAGALHYAPLYPALLAVIDRLPGTDLERAALLVNGVSTLLLGLGVRALVGEMWDGDRARGAWRLLIVTIALLSAPQVLVGSFALAEPAFFAVYVWLTVVAVRFDREATAARFAGLSALAVVLVSLRWAGAFMVVGLGLYLAVRPLRSRRVPLVSAGLGLVSFGIVGVWALWVRSFDRPTALAGHDQDGTLSVFTSMVESLAAFGLRLLGQVEGRVGGAKGRGSVPLPSPVSGLAFTAAVVLAVVVVAAGIWAAVKLWPQRGDPRLRPLTAAGLPALTYAGLMVATRAHLGYFVLLRYWGTLAVVLLAVVARAAVRARERSRPAVVLLGVALAVANIVGIVGLVVKARAIHSRPSAGSKSEEAAPGPQTPTSRPGLVLVVASPPSS